MAHSSLLLSLGLATATMLAAPYVLTSPKLPHVAAGESEPAELSAEVKEAPGRQAFPGAEGFGRFARGGRGGAIIPVTTLADSGPGSLRACIEASMPRVCVFRVAGVIRFTTERPIIRNPYLTIAGQTAPGGGILITHAGGFDGLTPVIVKGSHDVIIRHLRVRTDLNGERRGSNGSFLFEDSHDVIFDHVSGAWALDQIMSGEGFNNRITVSNSIFSQGIPRHDKCVLFASSPDNPQMISFLRNLCAHNGDRNPDLNLPPHSCVEVVNNIFYNGQSQFAEVHETSGGTPVSFVANIFRRGPNSRRDIAAIDRVLVESRGASRIHVEGNRLDGVRTLTTFPVSFVRSAQPVCPLQTRAVPAEQAYRDVLVHAGAHPRDSLDIRTVRDVREQGGRILKDPSAIRGPRLLPLIRPGQPYADQDGDGMSDRWETANRTNPGRADPWADADRDGWANLDEFLDFAHREVLANRPLR
ncbi:pectate lyase [Sphingomonas arenae]|uniref:pectate lyase n=1 Tax=Sphingomonas arenae TaxID=2812555 RepID=UPI0019675F93|nr:pectate lyase [Sphingomonas arenae]